MFDYLKGVFGDGEMEIKGEFGGDEMTKRVLLVMKRKMLSDALIDRAASSARFNLIAARNYSTAALIVELCTPEIVVIEIPESGSWKSAEKCLGICDMIREQRPNCKLVVLCNENDSDSFNATDRKSVV